MTRHVTGIAACINLFGFAIVALAQGTPGASQLNDSSSVNLSPSGDGARHPNGVRSDDFDFDSNELKSLPEKSGWEFTLSPYLWMSSVRAEVEAGPISADVDKCFTDLLKQLKIGGSLRFEGLHDHWGFYLDGTYLNLGDDARVRVGRFRFHGIDVDADFVQAWLDFGGLYRFGESGRAFDLMLGGRYMHMSTDASIGPLNIDRNDDEVSPVLGGRIEYALSAKWLASVKADAGGFGVGNAADLVWGVTALVGYRWNDRLIIGFGYRYYDIETSDGRVDVDMQYHGPMAGFSYTF